MMKNATETIQSALTGIKEPSTKENPECTETVLQSARRTLKAFETLADPQLERMACSAESFRKAFVTGSEPHWLSLLGNSGTGKTFLADMVYRHALTTKQLTNHRELLCGVHKAFWPKTLTLLRGGEYHHIDDLADAHFAYLDEIAAEHDPSGFARDKLCELLSRRVGKWTLITSNLTLEKLADIDTRISSRMIRGGSVVVEVDTIDYALRR